jgi:F-type H+-transporting ATPase subunit delta
MPWPCSPWQRSATETDVGEELDQLAKALDTFPYLPGFLTSPTVDLKRRRDTIEKMFRGRASETFVDGLQVLNRNGRLGLIRAISNQYRVFHQEAQGRLEAVVQSASPLSPAHLTRLRDEIKRRTGKDVDFVAKVDANLIGGLILQVGDKKVDASLYRKLRKLSDALMERASREVLRAGEYVA